MGPLLLRRRIGSPWRKSSCIRTALHPSSTPTRLPRWGPRGRAALLLPHMLPGILGRRALPAGRIAVLGATMDLHHGLQASGPDSLPWLSSARILAPPKTWPRPAPAGKEEDRYESDSYV